MIGSHVAGAPPAAGFAERSRTLALWAARAVLYLAVSAAVGARGGGDAGFVRLLADGHAILAGRGFLGHFDVLSSVLYAAIERGAGFAGLASFGAFCAIAMLALVEAQARECGAEPAWALAAAAGAALLSIGTLSTDGGSFAWLPAAAFVLVLTGNDKRRWIVAALLAWAWAASSWLGAAAPALALAAALGRRDRTLLAIAAASAVAIFLTPAGSALPKEALAHLSVEGAGVALVWQPDAVSGLAYRFGFIPLVIALVCLRLPRLADWPAVSLVLALSLAAGTALPLAGIVILPCLVGAVEAPAGRGPFGRTLALQALAVALPCALLAPFVTSIAAKAGVAPALPFALVERLADRRAGRTLVFCRPAEWCALVDALGRDDIRAFTSDRIGMLDEAHMLDQARIAAARPSWRAAVARTGINAILIANTAGFATLLALQPDWHAVARSERATLFLRERAAR
jgi:hypothetical protein